MRFGSVCSGIEAASVAWNPLGWRAQFLAEIERFPSALLAHHYPDVPNHGDMNNYKDWPDATLDVLCGGTPCQSFSNAGLRAGLDDPRGQLMLTFGAIAAKYRPRWLVWENVPGVLSSNGGRDFGAFLGLLGFLGYGFAYRVLDAQFVRVDGYGRAVPQRRQRVFVVGCLGDWRSAAAVLLERESLRGDSAPRRKAGAGIAVAPTLRAGGRRTGGDRPPGTDVDTMETLQVAYVAHTLRGEGFDASEDGTGRCTPLVPVGVTLHGSCGTVSTASFSDVAQAMRARAPGHVDNSSTTVVLQPIAFDTTQITSAANRSNPKPGDPCHPLAAGAHPPAIAFQQGTAVRRLMPLECERLQGFPDGYTAIPWRGKTAADGPRYKALGNSWAVNCARWVGRRIESVDSLKPSNVKLNGAP